MKQQLLFNSNLFKARTVLMASLVTINVLIIVVSYFAYTSEKQAYMEEKTKQLQTIADMKLKQVTDWRKERLSDARYLAVNPQVNKYFGLLAEEPSNGEYQRQLFTILNPMFLNGRYVSMIAVNRLGEVFFSIPAGKTMPSTSPGVQADNGLNDLLRIRFTNLFPEKDRIAGMQISITMKGNDVGEPSVIGWLVLVVDYNTDFFPLIETTSIPFKTTEVLMICQHEGKNIYLNKPDVTEMDEEEMDFYLAERADSGKSTDRLFRIKELIDYKGIPVLVATMPVTDFNALLMVKIDQSEAYAEIRKLKIHIVMLVISLLLALNSSIAFFWSRQRNELIKLDLEKKLMTERFDILSKFANDAILLYSNDMIIIQVNDRALDLYGYTRDELLGMSVNSIRTIEARETFIDRYEEILKAGGLRYETTHLRKNGVEFPVEVSIRHIEIMGSEFFQSIIRDITQRKQYEKALIESEERLFQITHTIPQIVWTAKPNGKIDFVNSRFQLLTGVQPFKGDVLKAVIHADDFERVMDYWQNAQHEHREHQVRLRLRMKDGFYRWFLCLTIPLCHDNGEVIRWFGSVTDIDELENIVASRTAELEHMNHELEAFTYSVSHDLRAPLRAITGFTTILREEYHDRFDDQGKKVLGIVYDNANRMRQLIDDLLRLSQAGRHELNYSHIDMQALFNSLIEEIRQQYPKRIIAVAISNLPHAKGDLALLKQVITNLLSNAVKFSAKEEVCQLEIGSDIRDREIVFFVKDNGTGFDMKNAEGLFAAFHRLKNALEYEGTGIGLALVKRIIDKHGGRVWADSEPGKGSVFYFTLPDNQYS